MQELKLFNSNITMSSVEISELTGKRHDNVMSDINKLMNELNLNAPDFSGTQKYGNNNTRNIYNLPRRECDLLMMGYSIEMRAKVYDRWVELEQKYIPTKPLTELELAKKYVEALEYIEENKPKIEAFDNAKAIFPNKEYSEGEKAYKKDIKEMYPFLDNGKINNILEFYTTKKYKDSVYYIKDEIEECMKKFFKDCKYRISDSRISVIANHECLLNSKCVISKEYAIEYLGFLEEEFDL